MALLPRECTFVTDYDVKAYTKSFASNATNLFCFCFVLIGDMTVVAQKPSTWIRVITYNIRFDNPNDGENRWVNRKDRVAGLIKCHQPDIFGVQEALFHQLKDLEDALPEYAWYGAGREDGKERGEFSAVFYGKNRFELLNKGTFWLSPTYEKPSKGWDADVIRVCSWVKLHDKRVNKPFFHLNTHFDHVGEEARRESAKLILSKVQSMAAEIPAIITGDFNNDPGSVAYRTLANSPLLRDAMNVTKSPHQGPDGTWATFDVKHGVRERIDYIFVTPQVTVQEHAILTDSQDWRYPSDHLPVLAEVTIN